LRPWQELERALSEAIPGLTCPLDLPAALSDGVVLCKLVNTVVPGKIPKIYMESGESSNLKLRKNVDNFLEACRAMRLAGAMEVTALDIVQARKTPELMLLLRELLQHQRH
jgi:hypothetical protein